MSKGISVLTKWAYTFPLQDQVKFTQLFWLCGTTCWLIICPAFYPDSQCHSTYVAPWDCEWKILTLDMFEDLSNGAYSIDLLLTPLLHLGYINAFITLFLFPLSLSVLGFSHISTPSNFWGFFLVCLESPGCRLFQTLNVIMGCTNKLHSTWIIINVPPLQMSRLFVRLNES